MSFPTGFLALPREGETTMRSLTRKLRLLALGRLLSSGHRLAAPLTQIARSPQKRALVAAIGRIDVLAPTLVCESGLGDPDAMLGQALPNLLAELSRSDLRESLLWDAPVDRVIVGDTLVQFDPPATGILADPSGLEARSAAGERRSIAGEGEVVLHPVADGISLATHDTNPIAALEAHPDKDGNALDLAGRSPQHWCDALREALALIHLALPELGQEIGATLQRIVPVGFHDKRHLSASYREAPGLIYLTLHPSPLTLAEAIVHETQHGKLNTLSWFDPILHNGNATWTASPVRPDMRPLLGVLLAVHAFIPVAALHHRLRTLDHPALEDARVAEVQQANQEGMQTLRDLAEPTGLGARVIAALEALQAAVTP